ncbi:MAG: GNAT family N-acetyltransferase [Nibricoccus sp.]
MKHPVVYRLAGPDSLEKILPLFRSYQEHYNMLTTAGEAKTRRFLAEFLTKPETGFALVAESGGVVVGFATGYLTVSGVLADPLVHLGDLYVLPEYRRGGIATALIERVAKEARERGVGLVRWLSMATNTELNPWYASLGTTSGDFKLFLKPTGRV